MPTDGAPITPRPAHLDALPSGGAHWHPGQILLTLIVLIFVVSAVWISFLAPSSGGVTVLVRAQDGTRTIETLSLAAKRLSVSSAIPTDSAPSRAFPGLDGSTILLSPAGIVEQKGGETRVLVVSITPPTVSTPFAVFGTGALVAWVSPTDKSLQVFYRTPRGTYQPLYINSDVKVNSLGFTEDGSALVITTVHVADDGSVTTDMSAVSMVLETKTVNLITTRSGIATILNP